ncbi:MAG: hypothetical protein IAF94_10580 [Pirellulaceae bacterium]|nr:hypothetical protein [Pirellulaceae bacterium]
MSKKNKKRPKPSPPRAKRVPLPTDGETRQSVAVTVAWMLTLLVTVAAEVIAVPATIISKANPQPLREGITTAHIADLFLFLALVTGLLSVGLVPLVYRVRTIPPPPAIVVAALVAAAVPPITMVLRWLL